MENTKKKNGDYYTIDLLHIAKALWHRAWLIILCAVIVAAVGFSIAAFAITPTYTSSIMLYVNNSSFSVGNTSFSITASEISAAQSLVKTYVVMLQNRTTLEMVIEKADLPYNHRQLGGMLSAASVNDTEVLQITATSTDPYEAADIVNCVAEVLPVRIAEIIEGASMEVVDYGAVNLQKVAPSITKYTMIGGVLGGLVSAMILAVFAVLDDTIHDEDYITQTYEYPILAKIPNLLSSGSKNYGYQSYYKVHSNIE
ncbi:MAG: hypothetical protein E7452_07535 [Ruminococcaceae bacterium]|nr:hypothetical protein [Oscillospiraceae bacterium]